MPTVYAFMNLKGGVGKTTLAANLGYQLAVQQQTPAILIDTDPQCNLTQLLVPSDRVDTFHPDRTVFATFRTPSRYGDPHPADLSVRASLDPAVHVDLIPGSFETLRYGVMQNGLLPTTMMQNFRAFVDKCKTQYDTVILDTNPSSTFTTLCALSAADYLVAPVTLDVYSVKGIDLIREVMSQMYPWLNDPERVKIIFNRIPRTADPGKLASIQARENEIRTRFPELSPSIMAYRIHETSLLSAATAAAGFAVARDDGYFFTKRALSKLKEDVAGAATDLIATASNRLH